jgi:LysM repeat protein
MQVRQKVYLIKYITITGIFLLAFTLFAFQSQAQITDSIDNLDNYRVDTFSKFQKENYPNEITKLWDTSRIGAIAISSSNKETLCIHLTDDEHCCFAAPTKGEITSNFGWRNGRLHAGVDIDLETGDPVFAAFDGIVRHAGWNHGYGYFVIISHFNGLETLYGHLSALKTDALHPVKAGQLIGLGGNTGHSYGSHLHFEVRYFGKPLNPKLLIDFESKNLHTDTLNVGKPSTFSKSGINKSVSSIVEVSDDSSQLKKEALYDENIKVQEKKRKELEKKKKEKLKREKEKKELEKKKLAKATYHTVGRGDTLYAIALKYHTSVEKLCALNKMNPTDILALGRKIKLK